MATQYGIDLGEVYRTTEAVKGSRMANKLAQLKLGEAEAGKKRRNVLSGLRGKAVTGDIDAQQQLLALDPEGGATFIDAVAKMDDRKRDAAKRTVDEIGKISATILQASPEKQNGLYLQMRELASPEVRDRLPEQFDPNFMELSLSKAMAMDKILEAPTVRQIGGEDVVYRGGREVERKTRPVKAAAGDKGGLKSADESLMYRQAAELLGGVFDQQGNITNLDPETRNRVQAIATEAANIFVKEGNITRSEAVKRAAKGFGLNVRDVPPANPADPNSIRSYLLNQ